MATALTQISGYAHVAARYGFEEAVFLHSVMFWYRTNRGNGQHFHEDRWWTYNSVKAFEEIFPWWNGGQIRRIIARCREKGALLAGDFNEDRRDRTAWYSPSDELLELYGENANCICRKQQMQLPEPAQSFDENGKCNIRKPCGNHGETEDPPYSPPEGDASPTEPEKGTPVEAQRSGFDGERRHGGADELSPKGEARDAQLAPARDKPAPKSRRSRQKKSVPAHAPERFEQFWAAYPGGGSRLRAVAAWDALAPDDGLIDEMARALKRQMRSPQWREGIGIPHASTWLNNARWTDKLPEPPRARDGGTTRWDPEPEEAEI